MSRYRATVRWSHDQDDGDFTDNRYTRRHSWSFDGGITVAASASPSIVPLPMSAEDAVDPEEAFVASLASCHMLFFLSLAAAKGLSVRSYEDQAEGFLEEDGDGVVMMTRVILRPAARYGGGIEPERGLVERLHHEAHRRCFIANSVRTDVIVDVPG